MPQGIVWFPLVAIGLTVVLLLTVRRKPDSADKDKTDK